MPQKTFEQQIDEIPGKDGWWKSYTGEFFQKSGNRLVALGMSEAEALDMLTDFYGAVSGEYGN